jgi:hypothetical protein
MYSLYPGNQIWEGPKQYFATPFIQSIATKNIFTNQLKQKADFLSNIYNTNIAGTFVGKIYEEIMHAKIFNGNFEIVINHLPESLAAAESSFTLKLPCNFVVKPFFNDEDLFGIVETFCAKSSPPFYIKPMHGSYSQIDAFVMHQEHRYFLQMTISDTHPIDEIFVASLAHKLWPGEDFKYIYVVPAGRAATFKRQPVKKGKALKDKPWKCSTKALPLPPVKSKVEQYVSGIGRSKDNDWMGVELIDKLMLKVEDAFADFSRYTLRKRKQMSK